MAFWIAEEDLKELIGKEAAATLMFERGGLDIFVPKEATAEHPLAKLLGLAAAKSLCDVYASTRIVVPNGKKARPKNKDARQMLGQGMSVSQVAAKLGLTERYVWELRARERAVPQQGLLLNFSSK